MKRCTNPDCPTPPDERRYYPGMSYCVTCAKANAVAWIAANRARWNRQRRRNRLAKRLRQLRNEA